MHRRLMAAAAAAALALGAAAPRDGRAAQIGLPLQESSLYLETDRDAAKLLDAARKAARAQEWRKAAEAYQRVIDYSPRPAALGDPTPQPLVPSPDDPSLFLPIQDAAALELVRLPEAAVETYREVYNGAAMELLEGAFEARDVRRIAEAARRYAATTRGDDALRALAAMAFERGDHVGVLRAWQRLARAHPRHALTFASLRAQVWASLRLLGRSRDAQAAAKALLDGHGGRTLDLGGKAVPLADFLKQPLDAAQAPPLTEWPLLGGDATRARLPAAFGDPGERLWTAAVPSAAVTDAGRAAFERRGFAVPYVLHAAVSTGRVFVADDASVYAWDIASGRPLWMFPDGAEPSPGHRLDEAVHAPACADGRLFVRLADGIAAFEADTGRLLWRHVFERRELKPKKKEKKKGGEEEEKKKEEEDEAQLGSKELVFATSPAVVGGLVIVGHTSLGDEARSSVVALDARDGGVAWRSFVCSRNVVAFLAMGAVGGPPAVAGDSVYYPTGLGALAALDRATGRIRWVRRYAAYRGRLRQSIIERRRRWANNPPLVHRGLVLAAPTDAAHLLAVDAVDGSVRWSVPRSGGRYLAGVVGSRAIVVGREALALDIETGKRVWATPLPSPVVARPLLCPDRVLVPLADRLVAVATDDGAVATARLWTDEERPGNLAVASGKLLVASCDRIQAFDDWAETHRRLEARRKAAPDDPSILLALGIHDARLGRHAAAVPQLAKALQMASAQPLLEDVARRARRELFAAHRAIGDAPSLTKAITFAPGPSAAAEALAALAKLHETQKRWRDAIAAYQALIETYGSAPLRAAGGLSVAGRAFATAEIARLIREHGREVYEAQEAKVRERFLVATTAAELEAIARSSPNSVGAEQALLKRMDMPDARQMAPDLAALVRTLAADGASPARELIASTLTEWRKAALAANPPLTRRWRVHTRVAHRRVEHFHVDGLPKDLLYFATARRSYDRALPFDGIECRAPDTGQLLWQRDLREWDRLAVAVGGHIVIATFDRLLALDATSGALRWAYSLSQDSPLTEAEIALPAPGLRVRRRDERRRVVSLAASHDAIFAAVSGGKVFALTLVGERRWARELGSVERAVFLLARGLHADGDQVWVVAEHPAGLYALDQADGSGGPKVMLSGRAQRITDLPAYDAANGRLYLILGDRAVSALDLRAGRELWRTPIDFGISRVLVGHEGKHCYVLPDSFAQDVQIISLDPTSGRVRRRRSLRTGSLADAAAAPGVVYLAEKDTDNDLVIQALDPDTLGMRWRTVPLRLFNPSALAVSAEFVAISGRHAGEAAGVLVDASTGKIAGDVKPPGVTRVSVALRGDLFCLSADRGIHAYGPVDREQLGQRIAVLAARHAKGDRAAAAPLAGALYQRGDDQQAVDLLAKALADEDLPLDAYAALKDQLNSIRESLAAERPPVLVARRFETPPNIDGAIDEPWRPDHAAHLDSAAHIDEVQGRPAAESRWKSRTDLSAVLYAGWDDKHFYFAVDVNDDIHRTYTSQRDTWVGDGLIISIDCDNDGGFGYAFNGRDLLLTLALTSKDERKQEDEDEDDSPKGAYRVRRKDDSSGTIYECAIPWKYMNMAPPRPGQRLGFNATITDDDGDRASKAVSWTPGMILDRDRAMMIRGFTPAWFGDVLLEGRRIAPAPLKPPAVHQPDETRPAPKRTRE